MEVTRKIGSTGLFAMDGHVRCEVRPPKDSPVSLAASYAHLMTVYHARQFILCLAELPKLRSSAGGCLDAHARSSYPSYALCIKMNGSPGFEINQPLRRRKMTIASGSKWLRVICILVATVASGLLLQSEAHAQAKNYQLFRFDLGAMGGWVHGSGSRGGGGYLEPKFNVLDSLAVGLRIDGLAMFGGSYGLKGGGDMSMEMMAASTFLAKCDYYLLDTWVRPFVGMGAGIYYLGGQSISVKSGDASINQKAGKYFGIAPQIGIQLGAFRLGMTYNAIMGASMEVQQTIGTVSQRSEVLRNYVTFEIGGTIGGGRKEHSTPYPETPPGQMPPGQMPPGQMPPGQMPAQGQVPAM
jgi:hypothetical protein